MCIIRYILIISILWAGHAQAFSWGILGLAASYLSSTFFVNKILNNGSGKGDELNSASFTSKIGNITGPSYVGCAFNDPASSPLYIKDAHSNSVPVRTYFKNLSSYCSTKINTSYSWFSDHKLRIAGISLAMMYGYTLTRIILLQNFMSTQYSWGAWHEGCDWNNLSFKEKTDLREELLVEVRKRYPKSDDLVPVYSFMNDLEKEVGVYNNYMTLVERINQLYSCECFVTDRFKDAYIGLLGNTINAQMQGKWIFDWLSIKRWLCLNEQLLATCIKRREHVLHLKAFYAEWLTTVRAIYKQSK